MSHVTKKEKKLVLLKKKIKQCKSKIKNFYLKIFLEFSKLK